MSGSACTAADAALALTLRSDGRYAVLTNVQLASVCACRSIDYLYMPSCNDCVQATLDSCLLESITGQSPTYAYSLDVAWSETTSLRGLSLIHI